ncbi:MAG: hypothetical protein B0W54_09150 [Cellvibrio sp. 79]|nr:MAG: hypothetical protein B0W54_09150 [Cellvibrio sp. 79]
MNNKKTLICIEGSGKNSFDMMLFAEDTREIQDDKIIKKLIIERAKHNVGEDPNQSLEVARIELTQERAQNLWKALWENKFENHIFVDASHTPHLGIYIVKPLPNTSRTYILVTAGKTTAPETIELARFTVTGQRNQRLAKFLTEDWICQ